jgi:hypothetical protein
MSGQMEVFREVSLMKRKYNKAIATLTLIIMTLTMMLPLSANAAEPVENPSGTFKETAANDGTVTGTVNVSLDWEYSSDNGVTVQSSLPNGLKLDITGSDKSAQLEISTVQKVTEHYADNSMSFKVTFTTKKFNGFYLFGQPIGYWETKQEEKTFNIVFIGERPVQEEPDEPGVPIEGFERGKLRVLEVYPSNLTNNQVSGSSDPSKPAPELYNLLKTDSDYEVTYMSMNKFISLRDEINGNYDIVYFGKGTYNRNSIDETYFGNDITGLRADKVLSFINSNQLCILHDDVFEGANEDGTNGIDPVTIISSKFGELKTGLSKGC